MMMNFKALRLALLTMGLVVTAGLSNAQSFEQVRSWAAACSNCHGTNGVSAPGRETLAGMPEEMMVKKMQDFKLGRTQATLMHQLAKGYDDAQIAAIAKYFANLPK